MFLFEPTQPNESYFSLRRVTFGVLPVAAGFGCLVASGLLSYRAAHNRSNGAPGTGVIQEISDAVAYGLVGVVTLYVVALLAKIAGR